MFMSQSAFPIIYLNETQSNLVERSDEDLLPLTILQRITNSDKTAVEACMKTYGNLVWALAKKFTDSPEETENAAREVFLDIWKYACDCDSAKTDETDFIALIAYKCLTRRALNKSLRLQKKAGQD